MQLARETNFGDRTANEEKLDENVHTSPSFSFAVYCEAVADTRRDKYFTENFDLANDRNNVFGPHNGCTGKCSGTGWIPVSNSDQENPYRALYQQAEIDTPSEDGFHLVPCPKCFPLPATGELDEHIVKQGSQYILKSKKTGKNLGVSDTKAGAVKREGQVEYFKHIKEDSDLPGGEDKEETKEKDPNVSPADKKRKEQAKRQAKEKERKAKKLLPYEFASQKDADRSGGHLGLHGSHAAGNGIYKPGSSDFSLRDAVAQKKQKQAMRGKVRSEETDHDMDKANLPECTVQRWKDAAETIKKVIRAKAGKE